MRLPANPDMPIEFGFLLVLVLCIAVAVAAERSKQTRRGWSGAARRLRLRFDPGSFLSPPRLHGVLHGCEVTAEIRSRSAGNHRRRVTCCEVRYPKPLRLGLRLTPEGFFTGVAKLFGAQDIEVGDRQFDDAIRVEANNHVKLLEFLTPARRMRIHRFLMSHKDAVIGDAAITVENRVVLRDAETLSRFVERVVSLAWHLTGDRQDDESVGRAIEARSRGDLERALAELRQNDALRDRVREKVAAAGADAASGPRRPRTRAVPAPPPVPPPIPGSRGGSAAAGDALEQPPPPVAEEPVEEVTMRAEILHLMGRAEEATAAFREAVEIAPDDPELRAWVAQVSVPEGEGAGAPPAVAESRAGAAAGPAVAATPAHAPAPPSPEGDAALDIAGFCADLMPAGYSSFESGKRFDAAYKGREVRWDGVLRELSRFSYDYVFGSEEGTKAVFEVHRIDTGIYGGGEVSAIVHLPASSNDELRSRIGERVAFAGELLKLDGLMKSVYVTRGRVLADA